MSAWKIVNHDLPIINYPQFIDSAGCSMPQTRLDEVRREAIGYRCKLDPHPYDLHKTQFDYDLEAYVQLRIEQAMIEKGVVHG